MLVSMCMYVACFAPVCARKCSSTMPFHQLYWYLHIVFLSFQAVFIKNDACHFITEHKKLTCFQKNAHFIEIVNGQ